MIAVQGPAARAKIWRHCRIETGDEALGPFFDVEWGEFFSAARLHRRGRVRIMLRREAQVWEALLDAGWAGRIGRADRCAWRPDESLRPGQG